MRRLAILLCALAVGCGGAGAYGYSRTYEPLAEEEPWVGKAMPYSYEDVRRNPEGHKGELLAWFGTVVAVTGKGRQLQVGLDLRFHQERHACSDASDDSCRVTVSPKTGGPFTAHLTVMPEHTSGRDRISAGSLLKVYGHVRDSFDERGGPVLETVYYRHFPVGTYVLAGPTERMRR